jgi:hypothetical protein
MGWHDATLHAVAFNEMDWDFELLLDIDYIVRWIEPNRRGAPFSFLVAPATLVFEHVRHLHGGIETDTDQPRIEAVERGDPESDELGNPPIPRWTIESNQFTLTFLAEGFRQHFRARPMHSESFGLELTARGGVSFAQPREFRSA